MNKLNAISKALNEHYYFNEVLPYLMDILHCSTGYIIIFNLNRYLSCSYDNSIS